MWFHKRLVAKTITITGAQKLPSADILIAFLAAAAVFAYMPGPSVLYVAATTIARGKRAGWLAAAGIHIGGCIHVFSAVVGLAVIFKATPVLYFGLKVVGVTYLIYLGFSMFRSNSSFTPENRKYSEKKAIRAICDGATVEILNPKTALFYLAFLPQFTDDSVGLPIWAQLLMLGTVVNLMFSSADILCVVLAAKMLEFMKGSRSIGRWAQCIGGTILIGLGVRLATSQD